jgi:hypothetical protein
MSDHEHINLVYHADVSTSYALLATDNYSVTPKVVVAAKANHTIYITRIRVMVTTDNANTNTFQDTSVTPIVAAKTKASPGIGMIDFYFGPNGFALTEGKGLDHANGAAGLAGSVTVTAYQKRTTGPNVS